MLPTSGSPTLVTLSDGLHVRRGMLCPSGSFTSGRRCAWIDFVHSAYRTDIMGPGLAFKAVLSTLIGRSQGILPALGTFTPSAIVGQRVSNYWKYCILRAAEEVVRAGVLSYAPGSESVHMFHLSHFHRLVSFGRFVCGCWGVGLFLGWFFWFPDQSVRSCYQPMTSLAQFHDCHSCYDERSIDQKKTVLVTVLT